MISNKPDYQDVLDASRRIADVVALTPLLHSSCGKSLGLDLRLKPECRQVTGSFKIRGAANKLLSRDSSAHPWTHIVTASSGNHGTAVAYMANYLGIPATIVVPENANRQKVSAAAGYGATVLFHGSKSEQRREKAREFCCESGDIFVYSHDDAAVIAGQGTIAKEIIEEFSDVEAIVVPVGGGGMLAGVSLIKERFPQIAVIGVEPSTSAGTMLSLQKGVITSFPNVNTIADGLRAEKPGNLNFQLIQENVDEIVTVSDAEILTTMMQLLEEEKILVEPSGATALAAILNHKISTRYKKIAVVLSGGNISFSSMHQLQRNSCQEKRNEAGAL